MIEMESNLASDGDECAPKCRIAGKRRPFLKGGLAFCTWSILAGLAPVTAQSGKEASEEAASNLKDIRVVIRVERKKSKPLSSDEQFKNPRIEVLLYPSKAPELVANFVNLARRGFYAGLYFHKQKNFVLQAGCPVGNGSGNAGYHLKDAFHDSLKHDAAGVVTMANIGPDTNSSQFCIMTRPASWLDGRSSIIGKVISGMDIVESLEVGDVIESIKVQDSIRDLYKHQEKNIERWNKVLDAKRKEK